MLLVIHSHPFNKIKEGLKLTYYFLDKINLDHLQTEQGRGVTEVTEVISDYIQNINKSISMIQFVSFFFFNKSRPRGMNYTP